MASTTKNILAIKKLFGNEYLFVVKKLEEENIKIKNRSTQFINQIINPIANWIDYIGNGDIKLIEKKSVEELTREYNEWFHTFKENYTTKNYIEKNQIVFDYRINNSGFYWVNLNKNHDAEMIIRLDNCGRVNHNQFFIELRENVGDFNFSRVAIVINKQGTIFQIKGKSNKTPEKQYHKYIFDFLLNYEPITNITFQFQPENDFKLSDLNEEQHYLLKKHKPQLFNKSLL